MARPLGETQQAVLCCLREHKGWQHGCGWYWNSSGGTVRLLESLVKRGLVIKTVCPKGIDSYYPAGEANPYV